MKREVYLQSCRTENNEQQVNGCFTVTVSLKEDADKDLLLWSWAPGAPTKEKCKTNKYTGKLGSFCFQIMAPQGYPNMAGKSWHRERTDWVSKAVTVTKC